MRSSSTIIAGTLAGALLTAALTGCTTKAPADPEPEETVTATASAEPTPEPTPSAGELIDVSEKDTIPQGLVPYSLEGRDVVVVDPAAPLPQAVLDDITARADLPPTGDKQATIEAIEADTGKRIVTVDLDFGTLAPGEDPRDIWSVYGSASDPVAVDVGSREGGIAAAEAFIAAQPDAALWVVLVVD